MAAESLLGGVHVVVGDTKLTAGLGHNGRDLGIVGLDHTREEMMRGLMVEGTWTAREAREGERRENAHPVFLSRCAPSSCCGSRLTSHDVPEPAVGCVVHGCGYLKLCPVQ